MKRPTATNFFERQESARKRTWLLVFLFILGVLGTVAACVALVAAIGAAIGAAANSSENEEWARLFVKYATTPELCAYVGVIVGWLILLVTFDKICELRRIGACGVAEKLGGTRIDRSATDLNEKQFYNIVEEIALAAGVPVPAVYVLRDEDGINACAIGGKLENSAVAATAGAVELLTRDELQGVVAHEIGHLVNGDVKMNMRLIGVLAGLQALTIVGIHIIRAAGGRSSKNDKGNGVWILLFGLGVMGIGLIGSFFASAIQAAISRQRELLADASAAQFTRNPAGLAGALKKIGGLEKGSAVASERSVEAAHLFFGSVFNASLGERLFRTHPDLTERILALDPTFDGVFQGVLSMKVKRSLAAEEKRAEEARKKRAERAERAEEARKKAEEKRAEKAEEA
ncbi:MAG: M48 family metallopeptidase, partial [Thermoguttaceae bacterium]|nr:M48 family metallopeptidase [Thermoguttaceae bacterium]